MFNIIVNDGNRGNANQNQMYCVTPTSMNIIIIKKKIVSVGEDVKKMESSYIADGIVK